MIKVSWDSQSEAAAVILWEFQPDWVWQDFYAAIDSSWEKVHERTFPTPVDTILQMYESMRFPSGSPFAAIGHGLYETAKQDGIVVVTVANQFQRSIINIVRQGIPIVGSRLYGAADLDEARQHVVRYR